MTLKRTNKQDHHHLSLVIFALWPIVPCEDFPLYVGFIFLAIIIVGLPHLAIVLGLSRILSNGLFRQ